MTTTDRIVYGIALVMAFCTIIGLLISSYGKDH